MRPALLAAAMLTLALGPTLRAEPVPDAAPTPADRATAWVRTLRPRCIGPGNMGGRITALAVDPTDPARWFAATASGGLLRTTDDGITFVHRFDRESTVSIGDVAVAPSDPRVVWVGTGEANPRNSVSFGDGVYKSTDGGDTWKNMGLRGSFQIGAVVIHPEDPDTVYVGALGRLWGPNPERGLYRTTDGGDTWTKLLHVDDDTGVVDVAMHPDDPDTLLVATYERRRDGFDSNDPARKFGDGSALWITTDAGATFRKISDGLPSCRLGRIGLAWAPSAPDVAYAVVESERLGTEPEDAPYMGILGANAKGGARLTRIVAKGPSARAGLRAEDVVVALGDRPIRNYQDLVRIVRYHSAGDTVPFHVRRKGETLVLDVTLGRRPRPSGPARTLFTAALGGQRENLQAFQGADGHEFGGVYRSDDRGRTWRRVNTLNPRPMYFSEIRVAPDDPDRVYVLGIHCWQTTDGGKTFKPDVARGPHVDHHALWIDPHDPRHLILGNDGGVYVSRDRGKRWDHLNHVAIGQFYHVGVGPERAYRVYGGLQDNGCWGGPSLVRHGSGPSNADWFRLGGGDGFVCRVDPDDPDRVYFEMQYGGMARTHLGAGTRASLRPRAPRGTRYRFNWKTPFVLSHHNPRIFYAAGNRVFRSLDRGDELRAISPDIALSPRGTATALAESPHDPDVLWVGTDDGALRFTSDGGHVWRDAFASPITTGTAPDATVSTARLVESVLRYDDDGDGTVRRAEAPAAAWLLLQNLDRDGNDVVDRAEIEARAADVVRRAARRTGRAATRPLAELVPERRWVSGLEFSRHRPGRLYLVLDGHRSDDDRPLLFASEDHGATWRSLRGDLPDDAGTTRVLREDRVRANVLYLGTEFGAWVSVDRGTHWIRLHLPTVAVHEFAQPTAASEIVLATHGRSLWVLDVSVLRQIDAKTLAPDVVLFQPAPAVHWRPLPPRGAARSFVGENPPGGAALTYFLARAAKPLRLRVTTLDGKVVRDLRAPAGPGLHRVSWDLRRNRPRRARRGPRVPSGVYRVELLAGETTLTRDLVVEIDPDHPDDRWIAGTELEEALETRRREAKTRARSPWLERGAD